MTGMSEVEAARFVRAALGVILEHIGDAAPEVTRDLLALRSRSASLAETTLPPRVPERPETTLPWSRVVPGDDVRAPNGVWYRIDSVARVGQVVTALLVGPGGVPVKSPRPAGETVPVRRGETGQAMDVFAAAGISVEVIGS